MARRRRTFRFLNAVRKFDFWPLAARRAQLRMMGIEVGRDAVIVDNVDFRAGKIVLGDRVFINHGAVIDGKGSVEIGIGVHIAPRALLLTSTHELGRRERRAGPSTSKPIRIGAGSWIGAGCIVLPGVDIGEGVIVAAGSVAARNIPSDQLHAGVPAQFKRHLEVDSTE